jgi:hypothetical protein
MSEVTWSFSPTGLKSSASAAFSPVGEFTLVWESGTKAGLHCAALWGFCSTPNLPTPYRCGRLGVYSSSCSQGQPRSPAIACRAEKKMFVQANRAWDTMAASINKIQSEMKMNTRKSLSVVSLLFLFALFSTLSLVEGQRPAKSSRIAFKPGADVAGV